MHRDRRSFSCARTGGGGGGGSDHTAVLGNLGTREVCMLKHIGN